MSYKYYRKNDDNTSTRLIDLSALKTYEMIGQRFTLISKKEIRTWKALSVITFFAGIFATAIYFSAYRLQQDSSSLQLSPSLVETINFR